MSHVCFSKRERGRERERERRTFIERGREGERERDGRTFIEKMRERESIVSASVSPLANLFLTTMREDLIRALHAASNRLFVNLFLFDTF